MRRLVSPLVLLVVALLLLPGCLKVKQRLTLKSDLSGQVDLEYVMDFRSMARTTVQIERQLTGDETPVTDEEVAVAMEGLRAEMEADAVPDAKTKDWLEGKRPFPELEELPEGIAVLAEELRIDPDQLVGRVVLSFDHVSRLAELRASLDAREGDDKQLGGLLGAFEVKEKGRMVMISGVPFESMYDPMMDAAAKDEVVSMLSDMEFTFEIVTDLKVKMSDADKRKGLSWTWGAARMLDEEAPSFKAVLRR